MEVQLRLVSTLCLLTILSGCAGFQGYPALPGNQNGVDNSLETRDPWYADRLIEYEASPDKNTRDSIIQRRMAEIDIVYQDFEKSLYSGNVKANVYTDWAVLALTGTAAVIEADTARTALAGIATGLVGGKAAYDKNALFERTMPALITQMRAKRNQVKLRLFAGMQRPVEQYSLYMARADLDDYYIAGSIPGAIADLTSQASIAMQQSERALSQVVLRGQFEQTPTTEVLERWLFPGGQSSMANRIKLNEWIEKNHITKDGVQPSVTFFSADKSFESERLKAIKELNIPE